ncbi:hypothetical protein [Sphingomonas qomolangmaensis]|uniref:Uncharacterized protein n=1 Tax=Sphingomonas qomolangmaensis TaxID=2918765 RepID=A0ABY5L6W8_9SPHN|nr:hypothetical protein [Sphingomonas qomolangmaensis]UUL81480.1 hypothetical protein NMP03_09665 [Sphingomonas qomolangmaensis]
MKSKFFAALVAAILVAGPAAAADCCGPNAECCQQKADCCDDATKQHAGHHAAD